MKALVLIASLFAVPAFAAGESGKIYRSLKADEAQVEKGNGYVLIQKEVGGLECWKKDYSNLLLPSDYDCSVRIDGRDDSEIYNSLIAKEVNVTPDGLVGVAKFEKRVGSLYCTKSYPVVANPISTYRCGLQ